MQASLTRNSCNRCRSKKLRCERHESEKNCERCQRAGVECVFGQSRRGRRPSAGPSTKRVFIDSTPTLSLSSTDTIRAGAPTRVPSTDRSVPSPTPPQRPAFSSCPSNGTAPRSSDSDVNDFNSSSESFLESFSFPRDDASFGLISSSTRADVSSGQSTEDNSDLTGDFFEPFDPHTGLNSGGTFHHSQARDRQCDSSPYDAAGNHQWSSQEAATHSKDGLSDRTSQHLKELSELDIELIRWTSQVASGQDAPTISPFTDLNSTDIWSGETTGIDEVSLESILLGHSGAKCSLETTLGWTQRLFHTLKGMLRLSHRNQTPHQSSTSAHEAPSTEPPSDEPIFDIPSLIHVIASYERLVRIYQTTIYVFPEIMRVKPPSSSSRGTQDSERTKRRSESRPQKASQSTKPIKYRAPPSSFYSHLPKVFMGAFQPLDPGIQLDTILHLAVTQLRKVGACVEELVRCETTTGPLQTPRSRGHGRMNKRARQMQVNRTRGTQLSQSTSNAMEVDPQVNSTGGEMITENESTGGDSIEGSDDSVEGDNDSDGDDCISDNTRDLNHPTFVVEALLRRVRQLEAEVIANFTSLQETVRSLPAWS